MSVRVESDEIELVSGMFDDEEASLVTSILLTEELDKIGVGVVPSTSPCGELGSDERASVSESSSVTVLVCEVVISS